MKGLTMHVPNEALLEAIREFAHHPRTTKDRVILLALPSPAVEGSNDRIIWYPGRDLAVGRWSAAIQTYAALQHLADIADSGVAMVPALVLINEPFVVPDPLWSGRIPNFGRLWTEDLPEGVSDAFIFSTPVVVIEVLQRYLCHEMELQDAVAA